MRITALVKHLDDVCCRYRIEAYRPYLEEAGHQVQVRARPDSWLARFQFYQHLKGTDALIIQRKLLTKWQLALIRRRIPHLIFDFDDAILQRSSFNARGRETTSRPARFDAMVRAADAVVAGNPYLREQAIAATTADKVQVIPTCVDVSRYQLAEHRADKSAVEMVWIGSSSTVKGLERIAPLLDNIGQKLPRIRLKVICDRTLTLKYLPVDFCPWSEATEASEIAAADIGISWLPDDPWSAGKCGLKVLQYMAAGLPVVANPVGVQLALVRHGETGFLAETLQEWVDAVRLLAADPDLRRRMGQAGRRLVESEYQVSIGAAAWVRLLAHLP